jgi:hypothetical protein
MSLEGISSKTGGPLNKILGDFKSKLGVLLELQGAGNLEVALSRLDQASALHFHWPENVPGSPDSCWDLHDRWWGRP